MKNQFLGATCPTSGSADNLSNRKQRYNTPDKHDT